MDGRKGTYRKRFLDKIEDRDPKVIWTDDWNYDSIVERDGRYAYSDRYLTITRGPEVLLNAAVVGLGEAADNGHFVQTITPGWKALHKELVKAPDLLSLFPLWHRKFEEFLAGAYLAAKWTDVILTPPSGDGGYDVEAYKNGRRVLDEAKAYADSRCVGHDIVRAILGVQSMKKDNPLARVTTTSWFAPGILINDDIVEILGDRLQLRDRRKLLRWLRSIKSS